MSCIHITSCHLACSPSAFPAKAFKLNTSLSSHPGTRLPKISLKSTHAYPGTRLPKISPKSIWATPNYQQSAVVCLFGSKGKSDNENQASPWNALEKAMSNFKKDQSVEDVLKQQIQKQEYYDGGDGGGKSPGGGGYGSGEGGDEGLSGVWDEFAQVILATMGIIFLYVYIIEGEEMSVLAKDFIRFVFTRQKSIRLKRLMDQCSEFLQMMREKREYDDPYWLEREIINTPTCYDHPGKYKWLIEVLDSIPDDDE